MSAIVEAYPCSPKVWREHKVYLQQTHPELGEGVAVYCLAARRVGESLHAVFQLEPEAARAAVSAGLGDRAVRASNLPLEEMFVELVGGRA